MKSNILLFLMSIAFYHTTFCSQQIVKSAQAQAKDGKEAREQVKLGQDRSHATIKEDAQFEAWKKTSDYTKFKASADADKIPQEQKDKNARKAVEEADKNRVLFWLENGVSAQTVFDEAAVGMYHYTRENKDFHWDLVHLSLQLGADPMECVDRDMLQVYLAADLASRAQNLLDPMLSDSRTKLDEVGQGELTMLQVAARHGNVALVKKLVFLGVAPHSNLERNIAPYDYLLNRDTYLKFDGEFSVFKEARNNPEIFEILNKAKRNHFSFMSKDEQKRFNKIRMRRERSLLKNDYYHLSPRKKARLEKLDKEIEQDLDGAIASSSSSSSSSATGAPASSAPASLAVALLAKSVGSTSSSSASSASAVK